MNRAQKIKEILDLIDADYVRGVAEVVVDHETMQKLKETVLMDMNLSYADGPTNEELVAFMDKYKDRDVELKLLVFDPTRDDFRINVKAVSIPSEQAKITNGADMLFWMDFMNLGKVGCVSMVEDDIQVSWEWFTV